TTERKATPSAARPNRAIPTELLDWSSRSSSSAGNAAWPAGMTSLAVGAPPAKSATRFSHPVLLSGWSRGPPMHPPNSACQGCFERPLIWFVSQNETTHSNYGAFCANVPFVATYFKSVSGGDDSLDRLFQ